MNNYFWGVRATAFGEPAPLLKGVRSVLENIDAGRQIVCDFGVYTPGRF